MLTRYALFNSIVLFVIAFTIYFYNSIGFLWFYDQTRVSFGIFAIYVLVTAYIGLMQEKVNFHFIHFISNRLTSIGLVGTVVGIMLLMNSVGTANLTNVSEIVPVLFKGMSTLLITTLFGMIFSLLIDFQMKFIYWKPSHDEQAD